MIETIQHQLERIDPNQAWLVGVSGGRDSVCLLDVLVRANFSRLVVVHVNHNLRGEESAGDAQFVEQLASQYGLAFYSESIDVQQLADAQQKGLELAAREVRHTVFARAQAKFSAAGVLLGHHADDQAETVLFNLLRGSNGLKGMSFENSIEVDGGMLRIVRLLLDVRREEIDTYIEAHGVSYREDASNAEGFTARNRIRNEVMPLLKDVMQREVVPNVNAAAEVSMELSDYFASEIDFETLLDPQGRIFLPAFKAMNPVLQQSALFQYLVSQEIPELSRSLILECLKLCDLDSSAKVNLPGGQWLRRKEQRIFVQRSKSAE